MQSVLFPVPDHSTKTAKEVYDGLFASSLYQFKKMNASTVSVYKGVPPTELEFATFTPADRSADLLATFQLAVGDLTDPLVAVTDKTDANWNNELNSTTSVNATATGEVTWAVFSVNNDCLMTDVVTDQLNPVSGPVILDTLSLTSGSPVMLVNFSVFINPYNAATFNAPV